MLIQCPKCQAKLELPADVEGKKVRCRACQEIFHVTSEIVTNAIQAGEPENKPPILSSDASADGESLPRRRSYDDDAPDIRRGRDDGDGRDNSIEDVAKHETRLAGRVMLVTFYVTLLYVLLNFGMSQLAAWGDQNPFGHGGGARDEAFGRTLGFGIGVVCSIVIFVPILAFIYLAGRALLTLGSRGIIITGIVMNGIMFLILGCGLIVNLMLLSSPMVRDQIPFWTLMPTILLNPLSCLFNGMAFIFAIMALTREPVARYYQMKTGPTYRPR